MNQETTCGYVTLLGRPNAGKSTLLNACVGQKIAGVSRKPQTTRNRILGIAQLHQTQLIFLDTPGIHKNKKALMINKLMNRAAWSSVQEANLICYLVDLKKGWHEEDALYLAGVIKEAQTPILICGTKTDSMKKKEAELAASLVKEKVSFILNQASEDKKALVQKDIFLISAKRPEDILAFKTVCKNFLPKAPFVFEEDDLTDMPDQFVVSEMIREQLFRQTGEEIPYGSCVVIESMTYGSDTEPAVIKAMIVVSKDNHKSIVIGKNGSSIKKIGLLARETIEEHLGTKVYLELFVRVEENWMDHPGKLENYMS